MSQGTRTKKFDSDELFDTLFESRNIEKIGQKLSTVITESVERCLESKAMVDKIGDSLAHLISNSIDKCLKESLDQIFTDIKDLKQHQSELQDKVEVLDRTMKQQIQANATSSLPSDSEVQTLQRQLIEHERYSKRDNLVFVGLTPNSYADAASTTTLQDNMRDAGDSSLFLSSSNLAEEAVLNFCNTVLKVKVSSADISTAHRLNGRPPTTGTSRGNVQSSIIVRFSNRRTRDAIFAARKNLKNLNSRVYINEHLTTDTAKLFRVARDLMKQKKIFSTWTYNGFLYTKLTNLPSCRPVRIDKFTDLPQ